MDKKGQVGAQLGSVILLGIALIVGVIFIQASADNVASSTVLVTVNQSIATVVNGTTQYITNVRELTSPVVYNETGGGVIGAGNYTITNNVPYNSGLAVSILPNTPAAYKNAWVVTGTGTPTGYISDGGGRSLANLIILLSCLALVVIAASFAMKAYNDSN